MNTKTCANCDGDGEWWYEGLESQDYVICSVCKGTGIVIDGLELADSRLDESTTDQEQ